MKQSTQNSATVPTPAPNGALPVPPQFTASLDATAATPNGDKFCGLCNQSVLECASTLFPECSNRGANDRARAMNARAVGIASPVGAVPDTARDVALAQDHAIIEAQGVPEILKQALRLLSTFHDDFEPLDYICDGGGALRFAEISASLDLGRGFLDAAEVALRDAVVQRKGDLREELDDLETIEVVAETEVTV